MATGNARQSASTVRKVSFLPHRSFIRSSDSSSSSKSSKSVGPMSSSLSSSSGTFPAEAASQRFSSVS